MERLQKTYRMDTGHPRQLWPPKREWLDKFLDEIERRNLKSNSISRPARECTTNPALRA